MNFESLIQNLQITHKTLYESAAKAVNTAMTVRNWLYGFYIVEYEQNGEDRAAYGDRLIRTLAKQLKDIGQKGMSFTNLNTFRQFYLRYPHIGSAIAPILSSLGIIQAVSEQSSDNFEDTNIQTLSEQSLDSAADTFHQTLSDKFQVIDNETTQHISEKFGTHKKLGLQPSRLLQTLSFDARIPTSNKKVVQQFPYSSAAY